LIFPLVLLAWRIYADQVSRRPFAIVRWGYVYMYLHLLVVLGVALTSVGTRLAMRAEGAGGAAYRALRFVGGGLFLWLLALALIQWVVQRHRDRVLYGAFVAALVLIVCIGALGSRANPIAVLAVLAAALVMLLVIEVRHGPSSAAHRRV
jgi:low temperature requirement protein LtrA